MTPEQRKAMRQALAALDEAANVLTSSMFEDAATALRQAIEQQPSQCWKCGDMDAEFQTKCTVPACGMKEQPADEPVAYMDKYGEIFKTVEVVLLTDKPLYTSPEPAAWVGLTDEEIMAIGKELGLKCRLGGNPNIDFDYARAIEAKLREKNT